MQPAAISVTQCPECKNLLPCTGLPYRDRANHFKQTTNELYPCPVCPFKAVSICAYRAHIRLHIKYSPYYCPECGIHIKNKNVHYTFDHDCAGFKMMRNSVRLNCPVSRCKTYHPDIFIDHLKENHIKMVYKCPRCVMTYYNKPTMHQHGKYVVIDFTIFYQCELCPGKLVPGDHIDTHMRSHTNNNVFPCWACKSVFEDVFALIDHHVMEHDYVHNSAKIALTTLKTELDSQTGKPKRVYRVVKKCDQCNRSFAYKCGYSEIFALPNECPTRCTENLDMIVD